MSWYIIFPGRGCGRPLGLREALRRPVAKERLVQSGMTPSQRENAVPLMLAQPAAPVGACYTFVLEASNI